MVRAAAKGNPLYLSLHFKDLLQLLLQNLQSPLAAPFLTKLFLDLRKTVFTDSDLNIIGELIAIITLRLCKPQCDLDPNWEQENINKAMVRIVGLIHEKTVPKRLDDENQTASCFSAATFSYTFPLLKYSLTTSYAKNHDEFIHDGLQIISEHAKLIGDEDYGIIDDYHPKYLPTKQMFLLLVDIICKSLISNLALTNTFKILLILR